MAFDFPSGVPVGTQVTVDVGGAVLVWDGQKWTAAPNSATGGGGSFGNGTVTSVVAVPPLTGGTITTSGTIGLANTSVVPGTYTFASVTVNAQGQVTGASSGTLPATAVPVAVSDTAPTVGNGLLWYDSVGTQLYVGENDGTSVQWVPAYNISGAVLTYGQLPPEVGLVPIAFPFVGKPPASGVVNVPMAMALTVPSGLAGTVVFASTNASASTTFTLNKISGGVTSALGTVVKTTAGATSCTLSGAGGSLAAGDVMQVSTPAQDATLADFSISVLCNRV